MNRLCHSRSLQRATIALVVLLWGSLALGGEIHDAAKGGDMAKVQGLLKDNPDLVFSKDKIGETPLHVAAFEGHNDVAELLLASKAEVNAKANDGQTPLHWAAIGGHKDVVELLLAKGAAVNAKTNDGQTPLYLADDKDVAKLLLAKGAAVNATDDLDRKSTRLN